MKRLLPILLAVLFLAGCGSSQLPESTKPAAVQTTEPAQLVSLYDADSAIEQQTGGAVRAYPLGDGAYTGLMTMADKLLVVSSDGILTVLQGEKGEVAATGLADLASDWNRMNLVTRDNGVLYYSQESDEVVVLDTHLQQTLRVALPKLIQGNPVLQSSGEVFYCEGPQIRALNLNTGVSRLVREHSCVSQELTGSFFGDTVIGCRVTAEDGTQRVVYLRADTGEVTHSDLEGFQLQTDDENYFAVYTGEAESQYVYGSRSGEPMSLHPRETAVTGVAALGGAVGYTVADEGLTLSFYEFSTGKRTAEVQLQGIGAPQAVTADGSYVWLTADGVLYRWDVAATQTADETVYAQVRYTADEPDLAGLDDCQNRVRKIRDTYGLDLHIWEDAMGLTEEYTLEEEYRVSVINDSLNKIEALLQRFPADFARNTGKVSMYLVRSLHSGQIYEQYWKDSTCHVVISTQETEKAFLIGLGFAIDTKVLGNSREFDTWDKLNPKGFKYTYDYEENARRENVSKYLDAFIDQQAMSFPTEDRSRIFAYGVLPEGAEYFAHDDLQDKLLRLCEAIREAYDLEDSTEIFPWEQYLKEPIAKES